jgi:transcriptional regulator with XRE-family HTH domain
MGSSRRSTTPFTELNAFEQRIQLLSQRHGKAPSALGKAVGLSSDTLNKWQRNGKPGRSGMLDRFAAKYGVSVDWLLSDAKLPEGYKIESDPRAQRSQAHCAE